MGQVTTLFVSKVLDQASEHIDRHALLESVGLSLESPVDPAKMISDEDYYALLERLADQDPAISDLPLRTGASMRCDDYGAFGLAFKAALTLRHSWARAERYGRILTSVTTYEVLDGAASTTFIAHRRGERRLGLRLSVEATLASVISISREVCTGEVTPIQVGFRHRAPSDVDAHRRYFACPVHFDAEHDAIQIDSQALRVANHLGDASISAFFDTHLQAQMRQYPADGLPVDQQVLHAVSRSLSEGVPALGDIAAQLGVSARTLQRRLGEHGHRFTQLVEQARRALAERLLRETRYSLTDIAFLTGFSEQSAFTRAFRRWVGQTPGDYRLTTQRA